MTSNSLDLGVENVILADELIVGRDSATGIVRAPAGSTVALGSESRPVNVEVGKAFTSLGNSYSGVVDFSAATVTAWMGHVFLGEKNPPDGGQYAELSFSPSSGNDIHIESLFIGGNQATGVLNFRGGAMEIGVVERGSGIQQFNWIGGTLHVGQFGAAAAPFDLKNVQQGTLAPGESAGTSRIFGNYTQGPQATTSIELAGPTAGSEFDQVIVSNQAKLAGQLDVSTLDGYRPASGTQFEVFHAGSIVGQFNTISGTDLGGGLLLVPTYSSTSLSFMALLQGDVDYNSKVDLADFGLLKANFGTQQTAFHGGDIDGDGAVGLSDFGLLKTNFGATTGTPATRATIPEPSSLCLAVLGGFLLHGVRVSRQQRGSLRRAEAMA
jgi:hypothetical protein